ncbi:hypothetical protein EDD22DRAFT_518426 [Suillus occidentalis]|nr:hypothetical protein EDD22DRAFT_518426 [Suillus occidentalis]
MSRKHELGRLLNQLRVFLKALARYVTFPLRLIHRLLRTLLQLYSRRRQYLPIQRDGRLERVAGSIQPPILPLSNRTQPQVPPLSGSAANSIVSLLSVPTPANLAGHGQQLPPVVPILSQCQSDFRPTTPSLVKRYNKSATIKQEVKLEYIPARKRDYSDSEDSGKWRACVHPEGALYFHDIDRGIYTDSYMRDERRRTDMASFIEQLLALMTCGLQLRSGDIELVVELTRNQNKGLVCRYYFVDHTNRLLFWLHEIPAEKIFDGVVGVEKWSHIKYAIQHQYWQACL